jgi:hypothetical protein
MKARRFPRGVYRRGEVLWIRFKSADGKLTRESTGQREVRSPSRSSPSGAPS